MSPAGSFFRFTLGFLTLISVSFGITFAVSTYELSQSAERQAAAAIATMLEQKNN